METRAIWRVARTGQVGGRGWDPAIHGHRVAVTPQTPTTRPEVAIPRRRPHVVALGFLHDIAKRRPSVSMGVIGSALSLRF